jgi:hypothetical protein
MRHFRLGAAKREVQCLLEGGAHLKIVTARDRATGRPIRFTAFRSHQVHIEGNAIFCRNDKRSVRLSSNWSIETALQKLAEALRTGKHCALLRAGLTREPCILRDYSTPAIPR